MLDTVIAWQHVCANDLHVLTWLLRIVNCSTGGVAAPALGLPACDTQPELMTSWLCLL